MFLLLLCPLWIFYPGLEYDVLHYTFGTTYTVYYMLMYMPLLVVTQDSNPCCTDLTPSGLIFFAVSLFPYFSLDKVTLKWNLWTLKLHIHKYPFTSKGNIFISWDFLFSQYHWLLDFHRWPCWAFGWCSWQPLNFLSNYWPLTSIWH